MKGKSKNRIEAEVVLRSANAVVDKNEPVRAETVRQRDASTQALEKVVNTLQALGFEVVAQSANSVSIAGTSELFRNVFKTDLGAHTRQDELLSVPQEIREQVEGVFVQRPPAYYDT